MNKMTPVSAYRLFSSPSNKQKVYVNSRGTPCITSYTRPYQFKSSSTQTILSCTKIYNKFKPRYTRLYQVISSYAKLYQAKATCTKLYQAISSYTKLSQFIPSNTKLNKAVASYTKLY